jgi:inner membrane protein
MDSLTHLVLGASIGIAVMGRRTALWKAALWGAACNTLPDLDVFLDHGDPIRNVTFHRAESHALFYLTLASPLVAAIIATLNREWTLFKRWWFATWLLLVSHPLLDVTTIYGTQLALPFTDRPFGLGSIFIVDPLYTLPLVVGMAGSMVVHSDTRLRWARWGIAVSTLYLAWCAAAQQHVTSIARASARAQGLPTELMLVTPTPFNTVLWRIVAMTPEGYAEGYYSLLDREPRVSFERFPGRPDLFTALRGNWNVERVAWFTRGFYSMSERDGQILITDLRMGQEPYYTFVYEVATRHSAMQALASPRAVGGRLDLQRGLPWLWGRARGELLPAPR